MNTKKTIRKILFVAMWLVIGSGMFMLLIAAIGKQKRNTCRDYSISIKGSRKDYFLTNDDVAKLLKSSAQGAIKGQPKASFNLQQMESLLESNVWIKDAQLYFDNKDVLHVAVTERRPVARVFTSGGKSFYIDENEKGIPLSENMTIKLPVFTGVPDKTVREKKDSLLMRDVRIVAEYISGHPFWTSQVAQVDLVSYGTGGPLEFELIPVIGNHVIKLGNAENVEQKFDRLFSFYKQVLAKSGFDKYKTVDVRFAGQVIGGKSENPRVDSVQLRKNVEQLLKQIKKAEEEADAMEKAIANHPSLPADSSGQAAAMSAIDNPDPKPTETSLQPKPADEKKKPKAVMKRR